MLWSREDGAKELGNGFGLKTRFSSAKLRKRFLFDRSKYWRFASSGVVTKLNPKGILHSVDNMLVCWLSVEGRCGVYGCVCFLLWYGNAGDG